MTSASIKLLGNESFEGVCSYDSYKCKTVFLQSMGPCCLNGCWLDVLILTVFSNLNDSINLNIELIENIQ